MTSSTSLYELYLLERPKDRHAHAKRRDGELLAASTTVAIPKGSGESGGAMGLQHVRVSQAPFTRHEPKAPSAPAVPNATAPVMGTSAGEGEGGGGGVKPHKARNRGQVTVGHRERVFIPAAKGEKGPGEIKRVQTDDSRHARPTYGRRMLRRDAARGKGQFKEPEAEIGIHPGTPEGHAHVAAHMAKDSETIVSVHKKGAKQPFVQTEPSKIVGDEKQIPASIPGEADLSGHVCTGPSCKGGKVSAQPRNPKGRAGQLLPSGAAAGHTTRITKEKPANVLVKTAKGDVEGRCFDCVKAKKGESAVAAELSGLSGKKRNLRTGKGELQGRSPEKHAQMAHDEPAISARRGVEAEIKGAKDDARHAEFERKHAEPTDVKGNQEFLRAHGKPVETGPTPKPAAPVARNSSLPASVVTGKQEPRDPRKGDMSGSASEAVAMSLLSTLLLEGRAKTKTAKARDAMLARGLGPEKVGDAQPMIVSPREQGVLTGGGAAQRSHIMGNAEFVRAAARGGMGTVSTVQDLEPHADVERRRQDTEDKHPKRAELDPRFNKAALARDAAGKGGDVKDPSLGGKYVRPARAVSSVPGTGPDRKDLQSNEYLQVAGRPHFRGRMVTGTTRTPRYSGTGGGKNSPDYLKFDRKGNFKGVAGGFPRSVLRLPKGGGKKGGDPGIAKTARGAGVVTPTTPHTFTVKQPRKGPENSSTTQDWTKVLQESILNAFRSRQKG